MVTTDISQLVGECTSWINTLRNKRTETTSLKEQLQLLSAKLQEKDKLQDLEHLQNQFYIQLINIHDLKHALKDHEQIARWEKGKMGQLSDATLSAHEDHHEQYQLLLTTLQNLHLEFNQYVQKL